MFTIFMVALALIAVAMVGCLLVATLGCVGATLRWCADRYRGMRSARVPAEADAA